jgi:amino acid transporter
MADITIPIAENLPAAPLDLGSYVSNIVGVALSVAALAAFIFLVFGGIQWITAGSDKGKVEEARSRITNAIIGLAIVAASWAIFLLVDHFFGIGITSSSSSSNTYADSSPNSGGATDNISFVCTTTTQCDVYCPNPDYVTVRNSDITCGPNTIGCACVHKDNPLAK